MTYMLEIGSYVGIAGNSSRHNLSGVKQTACVGNDGMLVIDEDMSSDRMMIFKLYKLTL